jgi:hypothetical protein
MNSHRRLYIQLGRIGDILNILPLCKADFDRTGERPFLLVAEEFRPLLDGVTYVEPIVFPGEFEDNMGGYNLAEKVAAAHGLEIVCTQIYGRDLCGLELCSSFLRESWARVPRAPAWGSLPLEFDHRDRTREAGVRNQLMKRSRGNPYIVLALNGKSSPFPFYTQLANYLRNKLGAWFDFVDVSGFIAPRFYDLLATLEGAHALITVDSGVLHLAAAVPELPVIAFVTRDPTTWHGSAWRPQHVARFYYDEAPECFAKVANVTSGARTQEHPKILHVWSHFQADGLEADTVRRMAFARATWRAEYENGCWWDCEFRAEHQKRSSGDILSDPRPMPYVRDVIDHALTVAPEHRDGEDVIAFTNADVSFTPGITGWILDRMAREGCAYTHRRDFPRLDRPLANEEAVRRGAWYPGSDAFFFTVAWWRKHREEFPDMVLGREQCDEVLRQLIKRHGGREIPDAIYHEKHRSFWENDGNREGNPANQHNRRLARKWFLRTGYGPNDPVWWAIPGGSAKPRSAIPIFVDTVAKE